MYTNMDVVGDALGAILGLGIIASILSVLLYVVIMLIYFLPFLISRNKSAMMLLLNIIFCPTIIGWIVLLVYAIVKRNDDDY